MQQDNSLSITLKDVEIMHRLIRDYEYGERIAVNSTYMDLTREFLMLDERNADDKLTWVAFFHRDSLEFLPPIPGIADC